MTNDKGHDGAIAFQTWRNVAGQEKIGFARSCERNTAGGSGQYIPYGTDFTYKYVPSSLSTNITSIQVANNISSSDFNRYSELVVLGVDDDDDGSSGTNAWQETGKEVLTSLSDEVKATVSKKYNWFDSYIIGDTTGDPELRLQFNDSAGTAYASRYEDNLTGGDAYTGNADDIHIGISGTKGNYHVHGYFINQSSSAKLVIGETVKLPTASGTGNTVYPIVKRWVGRWELNTVATNIRIYDNNNENDFESGSFIRCWGFD